MGEVVNLRQAKKQAARKAARLVADANAAKHGRTKTERDLEKTRDEMATRALDGHMRETE